MFGILLAQIAEEIHSGFLRHLKIRNNNPVFDIAAQYLSRRQPIRHGMRRVAIRLQNLTEQVAAFLIVVDYQNLVHDRQYTIAPFRQGEFQVPEGSGEIRNIQRSLRIIVDKGPMPNKGRQSPDRIVWHCATQMGTFVRIDELNKYYIC